jgi:peptidylprolyl isomerase domain and WD repeat-containing protein 1
MRMAQTASASVHDKSSSKMKTDPTFVCSAFKENRFYLFTRREPALGGERDFINERLA